MSQEFEKKMRANRCRLLQLINSSFLQFKTLNEHDFDTMIRLALEVAFFFVTTFEDTFTESLSGFLYD